jgi:hypothetical protein
VDIAADLQKTPVRMWYEIYLLQGGFQPVAVVGKLAQKLKMDSSIVKNKQYFGDYDIVDLQQRYKKYIHKRTKHLL